jgi:hypothetical protein
MKDKNAVAKSLADRTGHLMGAGESSEPGVDQIRIPPFILTAIKESLLSGETHYTVRPGMPELRKRIAKEIHHLGGPRYNSIDNVLITNGESESLFVTILGLGLGRGEVATSVEFIQHQSLFEFFELMPHTDLHVLVPEQDVRFVYREQESNFDIQETLVKFAKDQDLPDFLNLGDTLGSGHKLKFPPVSNQHTLLAGSLNALPGIEAFQTGYLLGPESLMSRIRVWKQAFSICSAAPSQRAALTALASWQEKE